MTFSPQPFPNHLYFITGSLVGWRPLLARPEFAALMLDSLAWHREHRRWTLYAYIIMPTHFHLVIKPGAEQTITTNLQSFGSFTAHAILRQLQVSQLQTELQYFATQRRTDATEKHQVWQPLQAKNIYSPEFLREKIEYIHNNSVAKHWALVDNRADYRYSSACFYDRAEPPVIEVDDARVLLT